MPSFDEYGLSSSSYQALQRMEISTPTAIQAQAIPLLLEGRDVIGQAQTGSGKTLAFGLPLIERCEGSARFVQALVLTPTRELARQVADVLRALTKGTGLRVVPIYGGASYGPQESALAGGAQIVVGTPGRVLDHLGRRTLRLDRIRLLVLDEADEMLDKGFGPDVERILKMTPKGRQTALFSATVPEWVNRISAKYLHEPETLSSDVDDGSEPDIEHIMVEAYAEERFSVLLKLLESTTELKGTTEGTTLVFGRTKRGVRRLGERLQKLGYAVSILEGNLSQGARDRALKAFRSGRTNILVATNVAARGLDILHIGRVINYECPDTAELFAHRAGRTGRMGRSGTAFTLVGAADLPKWQAIERALGRRLPRITPDGQPAAQPVETASSKVKAARSRRRRTWARRSVPA